jgi:hypothetical protein
LESRSARRIAGASLLVGLLVVRLCFDLPVGLNLPIVAVAVLVAALITRPEGARLDPVDGWLPAAAVLLAAGAAMRGDPVLQTLDVLLVAVLLGASVPAVVGYRVTRSGTTALALLGVRVMTNTVIAGAPVLVAATPSPDRTVLASGRRAAAPYARGLGIALPIVVLFVALFAGADAVFARVAADALHPDIRLGDLPARASLALMVAWLCAGLLAVWVDVLSPATGPGSTGPVEGWPLPAGVRPAPSGTTEALVVLAAVDALFAVFVALQVAYLFGGHDTLSVAGMTYSDYARRGFFELVVVAVLAIGLVVAIDRAVRRRSRAVLGASIVLVGLTGVVLASAFLRLRLYQQAYGWTELRFYVLTTIAFLAFALLATAALLARDRVAWLGHALVMGGVATVLALQVIGPVGFITDRNLERALDPSLVPAGGRTGIDAAYVASLGDDAIPALVATYRRLPPADARLVGDVLARRWSVLRDDPADRDPAGWNLGRARARAALLSLFGP